MSKTLRLAELNKQYEFVCNELVKKFSNKQGLDFDFWVSDEVGGVASFASQYFFNLSDIILDLKTKQPKGLILDWQSEVVEFNMDNFNHININYKSYTMGARYDMKNLTFESEYHSDEELFEIQNWDVRDAYNLVNRLRDMWQYPDYFNTKWSIDKLQKTPILNLELHTGGWSGNEDIISALERNKLFFMMWWSKTERGGHYYFDINFSGIGFKPVNEFIKDNELKRSYLTKEKEKFDWIIISDRKKLVRWKGV